jgi:hypothetical protein
MPFFFSTYNIFLCVYIFLLSFLFFFLFYIPSFTFIDSLLSIFLPLLSFFFPLFICFLSFWMEIMKNRDFHVFNLMLAWVNDPHAGTVSSSQQFSKLGLNVGSIDLDLSRGLSDDTCLILYLLHFPRFLFATPTWKSTHESWLTQLREVIEKATEDLECWPKITYELIIKKQYFLAVNKMSIFYFENFILKKNFHCCYPAFHSLLAG